MAKTHIRTELSETEPLTGTEVPESKPEKVSKKEQPVLGRNQQPEELPVFVPDLLRKYSFYSELYIDSQGGVYSPGTSVLIRRDAVLYKNPYHKS